VLLKYLQTKRSKYLLYFQLSLRISTPIKQFVKWTSYWREYFELREKVTEGWRKFDEEDKRDLYSYPNIIMVIRSTTLGPYYSVSRKLIPPPNYSTEAQGLRIEDLRCILMVFKPVLMVTYVLWYKSFCAIRGHELEATVDTWTLQENTEWIYLACGITEVFIYLIHPCCRGVRSWNIKWRC
jgi:hypothetical protein